MKKLFCILFCLLFTALMLVGCGDVERGEWLGDGKDDEGKIDGGKYDGYETINTVPEIDINLYIVVEDATWNSEGVVIPSNATDNFSVVTQATNTVNNAIKDYTATNYHTRVNVVYIKASEYDTKVMTAVNAENNDAKAANIVLVNSYSLMQDLYATGKLCPLDSYLATTKYGRLNTAIPTSLLNASKFDVTAADDSTSKVLYSIPNNHVIGSYEYLLINKNDAIALNISESAALALDSYEAAYELVSNAISATNSSKSCEDVIALVSGAYEDRAEYIANGYYCNVVKNPIADKNEAFLSAFAIINRNTEGGKVDVNDRAMEIIYNINTNPALRNLLQYGVAGTNYELNAENDEVINKLYTGPNYYSMNLVYTGNIMNAYLCEEIGWNEETKANAIAQNADSITVDQTKPGNSTEE